MTPVKMDHPRRIDQFIDYFGQSCCIASSDPRPYGGDAVNPRAPHRREAVHEGVITAAALDPSA